MSPGGCYETQFLGLFWDLAHGLNGFFLVSDHGYDHVDLLGLVIG